MFYDIESCLLRYKQQKERILQEIDSMETDIQSLKKCVQDIDEVINVLEEREVK